MRSEEMDSVRDAAAAAYFSCCFPSTYLDSGSSSGRTEQTHGATGTQVQGHHGEVRAALAGASPSDEGHHFGRRSNSHH
jgi:hypothetical protein